MTGDSMITIRQNTAGGLRVKSWIVLLWVVHALYAVAVEPRAVQMARAENRNTRFGDLTTKAAFHVDREALAGSLAQQAQNIRSRDGNVRVRDLKFTHLTTNDGLSLLCE